MQKNNGSKPQKINLLHNFEWAKHRITKSIFMLYNLCGISLGLVILMWFISSLMSELVKLKRNSAKRKKRQRPLEGRYHIYTIQIQKRPGWTRSYHCNRFALISLKIMCQLKSWAGPLFLFYILSTTVEVHNLQTNQEYIVCRNWIWNGPGQMASHPHLRSANVIIKM